MFPDQVDKTFTTRYNKERKNERGAISWNRLLAGTSSGCGKTTVVCALLQALVDRGLRVGAFKCGPDYIDPMFHSRIIGAKSGNLDLFFFRENTLRYLLARNSRDRDVSVIEGVMGYYDGAGLDSTLASSWETARAAEAPAVLVVPAKGAALSILAAIQGFLDFQPDSRIRGVILNRCTAMTYRGLAEAIRERFGGRVELLGFLPELPECALESRHLGLVTAAEVEGLREKLHILARQVEETIDMDGLLALAESAPPLVFEPVALPQHEPVRIAVACRRISMGSTWGAATRSFTQGSCPGTSPCVPPSGRCWRGDCPASPSAGDSCT